MIKSLRRIPPDSSQYYEPVNVLRSITEELFRVVVMDTVLSHTALTPAEEVGTYQAVEVNGDHHIHHHHGDQEVSTVVQPGVVVDDVPGEIELSAESKGDVCEEVGKLVELVDGGGLSIGQFQHQPHV